jgi:hypothetical protein
MSEMPRQRKNDKAIKTSISLPEGMLHEVRELASNQYGGNVSAYIQHLVETDMRGSVPNASTSDIMDVLTERFRPALKGRMHECMANVDQQLVLDNMLAQIVAALEGKGHAGAVSLHVVAAEEYAELAALRDSVRLDRRFSESGTVEKGRVSAQGLSAEVDRKYGVPAKG